MHVFWGMEKLVGSFPVVGPLLHNESMMGGTFSGTHFNFRLIIYYLDG